MKKLRVRASFEANSEVLSRLRSNFAPEPPAIKNSATLTVATLPLHDSHTELGGGIVLCQLKQLSLIIQKSLFFPALGVRVETREKLGSKQVDYSDCAQ